MLQGHLKIIPVLLWTIGADCYLQVQSGGSFDVDYVVEGPGGKIILSGEKERQGDFVFTATRVGDYSFCFNNEMSTFAEKFVDFEIAVRRDLEPFYELPD